ncbi:hypothetical protein ACWDUN_25235 [Mycobacterium sp. NPDC003323]
MTLPDVDPLPPARCAVSAGHSVPATGLADRRVAEWARGHGISVTAHDDRDLDLIRYHRIRPIQVVFRCGGAETALRRAVASAVSRFVVTSEPQLTRLAAWADGVRYLYLDDRAPLMLGDGRLRVMGLHSHVGDDADADEWGCAA